MQFIVTCVGYHEYHLLTSVAMLYTPLKGHITDPEKLAMLFSNTPAILLNIIYYRKFTKENVREFRES